MTCWPGRGPTWDCGYVRPTVRMQYTASSFAQPLTDLFFGVLRTRKQLRRPDGYFPDKASIETETLDVGQTRVFVPLFETVSRVLTPMLRMQHGRTQIYVLYLVLTLLVVLAWNLR